MEDVASETVMG